MNWRRRTIMAVGVAYLLVMGAVWSLLRVASLADEAMFDLEPDQPEICPVCTSTNVHVAAADLHLCRSCLAVYPISNITEAP